MTKTKIYTKISLIAAASLMLFATGCTSRSIDPNTSTNPNTVNNQLRQQNVRTPNNDYGRTQALNNHYNQNNENNRIEIADKAAESITKVKGVKQANVLVTRQNAYVAAMLNDGELSRKVEDEIAAKVRSVDPNVKNVYVSTNPEFMDRISAYVTDVQQGRPVSGFVEQFNEMVQRIFPNAR